MENLTESIEMNKNSNGGGLAINITGKYESNRHAIARIEKYTFGEIVKELKKELNGGFEISAKELLNSYIKAKGTPEWHHAGFLPKSYGGGMKKTYFLDEIPTKDAVISILKNASKKRVQNLKEKYKDELLFKKQREFLNQNAKYFSRLTKKPDFTIITNTEMKGKYGWFESSSKYKLQEYYSGYSFESEDKKNEYMNIK